MTSYRYIFGSLRTESIIAEIPLFGTYMDLELNVGGRFDGSFQLDQTGIDNQTLIDATIPGRCFVAVERDNAPVWVGFIWSRTYQSQSKTFQLYAQSFEKYPQSELLRSSYNNTADQLEVFKDLWTTMQAVEGRNMNINVPAVAPATVAKTITGEPEDFKYYGELMSSLSDTSDGFDWTIDVAKSGSFYIKTIRLGYPTLGTTVGALTFEYPGSVLNYYATESMSVAGTHVYTLGTGEGSTMISSEYVNQDLIDAGWPRWDVTASRKDIENQDNLDSFAIQEGLIRRAPMMILKPTMKGDKVPTFGSFGLGDACKLIIKDPRFPTGKTFQTRITKWSLQPQSDQNTDEFSLIFAGDEE